MNHQKILSRAWALLWHYRALWLFGFLFVLTGGSSLGLPGGNGGSSNGGGGSNSSGGNRGPASFPDFHFGNVNWTTVWLIVAGIVVVLIVLSVAALIIRYVAETALMSGVDEIETTGEKLTVRRGFRLGWSRQAGQLFLTDLLIFLPLTLGALALIIAAALPLLVWFTRIVPLGVIASVITGGLELLIILGLLALALVLSVTMPYIRRRVVLDKQGVLPAVRQGLKLVRASLVDTGLMWLLLVGIRIVWSLVMIPGLIVITLLAAVVGAVPGGLAYLISHSWVWAAAIGAPLFVLVFLPLLVFVHGLFEAYTSASWTLAYREASSKYVEPLAAQPA